MLALFVCRHEFRERDKFQRVNQLTLLRGVRCDGVGIALSVGDLRLSTLMVATLEWCIYDVGCQLVQVGCLICLAVRRSVVVLTREVHLSRQGLRRSGSQLVA